MTDTFTSTTRSQCLTFVHASLFSLKIANKWDWHYYEDALALDITYLQTSVFQPLFVTHGFPSTTRQKVRSQCITIPILRTRNMDGTNRSPLWLCWCVWLCYSLNKCCQLPGRTARVRGTLNSWPYRLVMNTWQAILKRLVKHYFFQEWRKDFKLNS